MPRCPAQYESEVFRRGSAIHLSQIRPDDAIRLVNHGLLFPEADIFTIPRPDPFDTRHPGRRLRQPP